MDSHKKNIYLFIIIPVCINFLLLGLYYSGIKELQQIIAPTIDFLIDKSWREFGLVEQLQNICLLGTFFVFCSSCIKRENTIEKLFFFVLSALFLALFLEEIDYGIHFYELIQGQYSGIESRNWHNINVGKNDYAHFLKQFNDLVIIVWFVVLPLLSNKINIPIVTCIVPSRYFIVGFLLTLLFSQLAHFLDGSGFDIIDGVKGNMNGNISEFRELNTYYLYLLYGVQISKAKLTFSFR